MVINNPLLEINLEENMVKVLNLDNFLKDILEMSDKNNFKTFHMNVCSLRSKFDQLEILLKLMHELFDCIVFSETHLKEEINLNQYSISKYKIYQTKINKRKTDGLIMYIRSTLTHNVTEIEMTDCNCLILEATKNKKTFICMSFYRSPNGRIDTFLSELNILLEKYKNKNQTHFILGDININIYGNHCSKVEEYLNLLAEHGYVCLINKPTRIQRGSSSCLDHVFSQLKRDNKYSSYIVQTNVSDHFSTALSIEFKMNIKNLKCEVTNKYREHTKIDYDNLVDDIGKES